MYTKFMVIKSTFPKPLHSGSKFVCFLFMNLLNEFANSDLRLFCVMYSNVRYWQSSVLTVGGFLVVYIDEHTLMTILLFF